MYEYLDKLNDEQKEAVLHTDGPLLIVAGAGSGKTTVLVNRVAYLVDQGVDPERILLLTFTNNAADNMVERAGKLSNEECKKITACTYHSFCAAELRRYAKQAGLSKDFTIIMPSDEASALTLVKAALNLQHLKAFPPAKRLVELKSLCTNKCLDLEGAVEELFGELQLTEPIMEVYRELDRYKKEKNLLNYDDLLVKMNELLDNDAVRNDIETRYKYVMVDEYQDTNTLQESIVFKMTRENKNIAVVGDDYQSIYAFRGSDISNILEFSDRIGGCKTVVIDTNYRSTAQILDLANQVMRDNADFGFPKDMKDCGKSGKTPFLERPEDNKAEAEEVLKKIKNWVSKGKPLSEFAVLERQSKSSAMLEALLTKEGIPYEKLGGLKFLEHQCVIDMMNYLRIVANPADELAWFGVLDLLPGVGEVYAHKILEDFGTDDFLNETKFAGKSFCEELRHLKGIWNGVSNASGRIPFIRQFDLLRDRYFDLVERKIASAKFSDESSRTEAYEQLESDKETIAVLRDMAEKYASIPEFLDSIVLDATPTLDGGDKLVISTIHSAKGMEWDVVVLLDCMEGLTPSETDYDEDGGMEALRCLYVALTRAKKYLYVEIPEYVQLQGRSFITPSHFLQGSITKGLFTNRTPKSKPKEKVYLGVTYNQKEMAKKLGAKWDNEARSWFCYDIDPCCGELVKRFGKNTYYDRDDYDR